MVARLNKFLGTGMYSVTEAALYARIAPAMMQRWLFGTRRKRAVVDPQYDRHERVVGFLDLIQTVAIRELRIQKNIPLPKFRQAIRTAKDKYGIAYPFAYKHATFFHVVNKEIVIKIGDDDFVEASGKHRGQPLLPFVEMYLNDLDWGSDGFASAYTIFRGENDTPVVLNPQLRFGEPLLPSGYTARVTVHKLV